MRDMNELFAALARSKFRSKFRLSDRDAEYLSQKGLETMKGHARDFVTGRLADAFPVNDGRQTPMKNHPVFVAQHATATCCRKCLEKWHHILRGRPLTEVEIDHIVEVLMRWLAGRDVDLPPSQQNSLCWTIPEE